jgi:hypothetical protein
MHSVKVGVRDAASRQCIRRIFTTSKSDAALQFDRVKKQAFFCFEIGAATSRFWPREKQNRKSLARSKPTANNP